MFESLTQTKITKNEKDYIFLCDPSSPLGEVHDVLMEIKGEVVSRMIANQKKEEELSQKQKELESSEE